MWYSFNHGMAHFISLDSETDLGNGLGGPDEGAPLNAGPFGSYQNAQVDWLAADLAAVDRTRTPWVVVSKSTYMQRHQCDMHEHTDMTYPSASSRLVRRLPRRLHNLPTSLRTSFQPIQRGSSPHRPQPLLSTQRAHQKRHTGPKRTQQPFFALVHRQWHSWPLRRQSRIHA